MSALLVEEATVTTVDTRPRWRHVPRSRGPVARPRQPVGPGARRSVLTAPLVRTHSGAPVVVDNGLQLTRRGLAVVITLFLALVATATLTLVVAFFSVSNDPAVATPGTVVSQTQAGRH